ncbi:MAG: chorismate-binding protein [Hymenobacteraceae bacterium]|nr:chorismate-binding protein [Hymenobacteraceae bacterium]
MKQIRELLDRGGELSFSAPYAVWRRPGAAHAEAVLSATENVLAGPMPRLEGGRSGFAFYPFQDSDAAPAFWLPADVYFDGEQLHFATDELRAWWHGPRNIVDWAPHLPMSYPQAPARYATAAEYQQLVADGVAFIRSGAAQKVVPSRAVLRELPDDFDAYAAFEKLCAAHPRAFVYLFSSGYDHGQTWLGATPELLAEVEDGHTFRTVALAGTQPAVPGQRPEDARWSQKELEEQANVTRYVIGCFKAVRLREYHEVGPRTVQAGHLWHLRTDYAVDLRQVGPAYAELGSQMLRLLHPTSAVAGMPRQPALDWLRQHEGYDRTYYAGFLGPVNLPAAGTSALYVNLRCMQVLHDSAILYAGAGLTPDSDPAREWAETEQKLRVVADVILRPDGPAARTEPE